jgi:hypothetical protein
MIPLITQKDRWHHCGEFNALHKIESGRRFVAKSMASETLFLRRAAQDDARMPRPAPSACLRCPPHEAR